jgi:16S rRNA (cytosine967-C5)-methyltransferase
MSLLKLVTDQNPRQIAAQILQQRRVNGEFTEVLLERALATARLSAPDRGLCHELVYGAVRRQATLDWLIDRKTGGREQKSALQNLLRLGLYQIFWLDRIPAHAAVHETVEIAKHLGFGPQAGFVNAVLRGYLREADATRALLADLKHSDPAIGYSHPKWLVERWQKQFGAERTRQLLEWNNTPPKTYARANTLRPGKSEIGNRKSEIDQSLPAATNTMDAGDLIEKWRAEEVDYDFKTYDWTGENLVFELKSHPALASLDSFRNGWFYVQDPSTLLAPRALDPKPGETVLDLCAAPGGKTTFIAQLMRNEGKIIACDVSEDRLRLIRENCDRLGVTCAETRSTLNLEPRTLNFDKILIDAPCSNTGVMRRRVDLRWRISPEEISRLQQAQSDLLKLAATKLKPGGVLVYSTCSLEPEENDAVVKEFLKSHDHFQLESRRELRPFEADVDGAFVARLTQK